jgi:hypothetical protein
MLIFDYSARSDGLTLPFGLRVVSRNVRSCRSPMKARIRFVLLAWVAALLIVMALFVVAGTELQDLHRFLRFAGQKGGEAIAAR